MRTGTKIGLLLIVAAAFAGSTLISVMAVKAALRGDRQRNEIADPRLYRGSVPAGARSQGGLWV